MWILIFLLVPLIGMSFPGFVKFLNWGVLFPIALFSVGSIAWVIVSLLTGGNFSWIASMIIFGLPGAIWITRTSLA